MKNHEIIALVNNGALAITNYDLEPSQAYKAYKFKKALKAAFDAIVSKEQDLPKEVGIEDAAAFDAQFKELHEKEELTNEEVEQLKELSEKYNKFIGLRQALLNDDANLEGVKTMPYEQWFTLKAENREKILPNGSKVEVFPDWAEEILEGVLWEAPDNEE